MNVSEISPNASVPPNRLLPSIAYLPAGLPTIFVIEDSADHCLERIASVVVCLSIAIDASPSSHGNLYCSQFALL